MLTRYANVCSPTFEDNNSVQKEDQLIRCFICDEVVESVKKSIVMDTKLNIPAKLSQLVGEEYTVVISEEDYLCSLCNQLIESMDELQKCIENIVTTLKNNLNKKYDLVTGESNIQQVENKTMIKMIDFEAHKCTMCSFASTQKHIFDNHIRTHVLDNIKISDHVTNHKLNLFKCGACLKTYTTKEECISHLHLDHTLSSEFDEVKVKLELNNANESYDEKEARLHTCNNCFLTFVDESLLAEHDCPQESDQDISEPYLKENEKGNQSQSHDVGIVEQKFLGANADGRDNSIYAQVNNQSIISSEINGLLVETSTELLPLENFETESFVCKEVLPSAEKVNEHCKKHKTNFSVENNDEKIESHELIVFDPNDDIVTSKVESLLCKSDNKEISQNNITTSHDFKNPTKNKVFVCGKCKFRTNLPLDLKAHFLVHLEQNSASKPNRTCSVCSITFERVARYQRHMKSHDDSGGPLNCSYCGIQVQDKLHLRNHNLQNHALLFKKPECDVCHETFATFRILKKHKDVKHRGNFVYKCNLCDKSFKQKIQLRNHLEYAHRSSPKCRFCEKTIENLKKLREHENRHLRDDSKTFKCDICSRVFKTHSGLRFHKLRHSGKYPFFCEICGHGFVSIKMLEEHRGVHTKEDRYMCDICGRMFCFYSSYMIHRKWHDNPLPYKCNICNQKFHHTSVLAVHKRRVHTGERPYKCPYCVLTFVVSSTYKKHLCLHTQEFPYNCDNCHRGFTTRKKYATHLAKTHGDYSLLNQGPKKCEYKMSLRLSE